MNLLSAVGKAGEEGLVQADEVFGDLFALGLVDLDVVAVGVGGDPLRRSVVTALAPSELTEIITRVPPARR